jgi:hypothetical protein
VRALGDWLGQATAEGKSQQQKSFSLKRLMWNPKGSR